MRPTTAAPQPQPQPQPDRLRSKGHLLLEATVALLLLAVVTLGFLKMSVQLQRAHELQARSAEALALAQDRLESLRHHSTAPSAGDGQSLAHTARGEYRLSWLTRAHLASDPLGGQALELRVAWTDRSGQAQSLRLHTYWYRIRRIY